MAADLSEKPAGRPAAQRINGAYHSVVLPTIHADHPDTDVTSIF